MSKVVKSWPSTKGKGMWYVLLSDDDRLYEAWSMGPKVLTAAPTRMPQFGYAFQRCGESPSGIKA